MQQRTSLRDWPLFRNAYRVEKIEELINPRDLQRITKDCKPRPTPAGAPCAAE
jgi:hypothetical protein